MDEWLAGLFSSLVRRYSGEEGDAVLIAILIFLIIWLLILARRIVVA